MSNEWRAALAALSNADARRVYAEVVLGLSDAAGLSQKKRERATTTLTNAGLIRVSADGSLELVEDAVSVMLAGSAEPKREGVRRYLVDEGLLLRTPSGTNYSRPRLPDSL